MAGMDATTAAVLLKEVKAIRLGLESMDQELASIRRALHGSDKPGVVPELAQIRKALEQIAGRLDGSI